MLLRANWMATSCLVVYLNPTLHCRRRLVGAYAVLGGGFYHKVTNFTVPTIGTYCDYYYGCYQYQATR